MRCCDSRTRNPGTNGRRSFKETPSINMKYMKFGDVLTKDPLVWRGHRFFIYLLCVPEMIFLGLLGLTYLSPSNLALQSAVFVVGMLTVGRGIFAKALAW